MKCVYCGSDVPKESAICPSCGATMEVSNEAVNDVPSNNEQVFNANNTYNQNTYSYQTPNNNQTKSSTNGLSVVTLVMGILAIITFCTNPIVQIVFGVLAIIFAIIDKGRSGMRKAGLVLGIIGLILGVAVIVITLVGGILINSAINTNIDQLENMSSEEISQELNKWLEEYSVQDEDNNEIDDIPSPSEPIASNESWSSYNYSDSATEMTYTNGISDDYMMTDKGSFKNLCDWLEYAVPGYPKETLRRLISVYFMDKESYEETMEEIPVDYKAISISPLVSLAWQIDHDTKGIIKGAKVYYTDPNAIIFEISQSSSYTLLKWDLDGYSLSMGNSIDNLTPYETTAFNNDNLAVYATAIEHAFNGERVDA